jgi:hypothetical protein
MKSSRVQDAGPFLAIAWHGWFKCLGLSRVNNNIQILQKLFESIIDSRLVHEATKKVSKFF